MHFVKKGEKNQPRISEKFVPESAPRTFKEESKHPLTDLAKQVSSLSLSSGAKIRPVPEMPPPAPTVKIVVNTAAHGPQVLRFGKETPAEIAAKITAQEGIQDESVKEAISYYVNKSIEVATRYYNTAAVTTPPAVPMAPPPYYPNVPTPGPFYPPSY